MIRVMIVAPYASLRAGLEALLSEAADCVVVGAASGSEELEDLLADTPADVLLSDMGEENTEQARLEALAAQKEMGLALLGDLPADIARLSRGEIVAWAYLRRDADSAEIIGAIRAVALGLVVVDRALIALFAARPSTSVEVPPPALLPGETLTAREREVLQLMAQGLANKQIGGKLSISLHTVKFHVASILAKMGAMSRTEAVTVGARRGLVTL